LKQTQCQSVLYARRAAERDWTTIISTGDKDLAQLVNEKVSLINTMTNEKLDI
jgi:DNA polymerase-1